MSGVLAAINATIGHRQGWQIKQINMFRKYAKYCKMDPVEYRKFLYNKLQATHEESPYLNNRHFEDIMYELECELEFRIGNGYVETPGRINLFYWRDRMPKVGKVNSRQKHHIIYLWEKLAEYLVEEKRSNDYLLGLAAKACQRHVDDLDALSGHEAFKLTEAIKYRLKSEEKKLKDEIPF